MATSVIKHEFLSYFVTEKLGKLINSFKQDRYRSINFIAFSNKSTSFKIWKFAGCDILKLKLISFIPKKRGPTWLKMIPNEQ